MVSSTIERDFLHTPVNRDTERGRKGMTEDITKTRSDKRTPVYQPIYDAPRDVPYRDIVDCHIVNIATPEVGESLTTLIGAKTKTEQYTDISGRTVTMRAYVGGREFVDLVEIIAELSHTYLVRIGTEIYSVKKSIVKFTTDKEISE